MSEGITPEKLMNNIIETLHDGTSKKKSVSFFEENDARSVNTQFNKLFGCQKPYIIFWGVEAADVLLWGNKKISSGGLGGATVIWVLFEWLNYHFFSLMLFGLVLLLVAQFVWSNGSGLVSRSSFQVPRLVLADELFVNIARTVGAEANKTLGLLQDIACRGNVKQFATIGDESGYIRLEEPDAAKNACAAAALTEEGGFVVKNYIASLDLVAGKKCSIASSL